MWFGGVLCEWLESFERYIVRILVMLVESRLNFSCFVWVVSVFLCWMLDWVVICCFCWKFVGNIFWKEVEERRVVVCIYFYFFFLVWDVVSWVCVYIRVWNFCIGKGWCWVGRLRGEFVVIDFWCVKIVVEMDFEFLYIVLFFLVCGCWM